MLCCVSTSAGGSSAALAATAINRKLSAPAALAIDSRSGRKQGIRLSLFTQESDATDRLIDIWSVDDGIAPAISAGFIGSARALSEDRYTVRPNCGVRALR
jgi:hypothetical protein